MAIKTKQPTGKVWMRVGDNDDYHDFDSMFSAGSELGGLLDTASPNGLTKMPVIRKSHRHGIDVEPSLVNYNYVSLFWGDDDAQPLKETTKADIADFKAGIRDGSYLFLKKTPARKVAKKRSQSKQLSLKGIRR